MDIDSPLKHIPHPHQTFPKKHFSHCFIPFTSRFPPFTLVPCLYAWKQALNSIPFFFSFLSWITYENTKKREIEEGKSRVMKSK